MDEKIEEMIKDIKEVQPFFYGNIAEMFIEKGYRKESDTAKEILQMYRLEDTFSSFQKKVAEKYGVDLGE